MIPGLTVQADMSTLLLLASAVTMRTSWAQTFQREGGWLLRSTRDPTIIRVSPEVTTVRVDGKAGAGEGAQDVYLVLGRPDAPAGEVLALGLETVRGRRGQALTKDLVRSGKKEPGPGIRIKAKSFKGAQRGEDPYVELTTPAFDITAETDLIQEAFGLAQAAQEGDHFPGIASNMPLMVSSGSQTARAGFDEKGFEAAAYSHMTQAKGAALLLIPKPPPPKRYFVYATFDRPFGFLAIDRATHLLLFAGWVPKNAWTGATSVPWR
jgi:hypothetical protein